jgi:hypothetical protein
MSEWTRVKNQGKAKDSPDTPKVSVIGDGELLGLLKHAYAVLGEPKYVCFYKSGSKVAIEPHDEKQGLNPHKISDGSGPVTSFSWHDCDERGTAPLHYDDDQDWYYFDLDELEAKDD